jgi:hypothetical protein
MNYYFRILKEEVHPLNKEINYDKKIIIIISENSGRILLSRSLDVQSRSLWGGWQNFREEAGFYEEIKMIKNSKMDMSSGRFKFKNIVGIIADEFIPKLGEGIEDYKWVMLNELGKYPLQKEFKQYVRLIYPILEKYSKSFLTETLKDS